MQIYYCWRRTAFNRYKSFKNYIQLLLNSSKATVLAVKRELSMSAIHYYCPVLKAAAIHVWSSDLVHYRLRLCKNLSWYLLAFWGAMISRAPWTHLRYEKSSFVPSVLTSEKHRESWYSGWFTTWQGWENKASWSCRAKSYIHQFIVSMKICNIKHYIWKINFGTRLLE